MGFSTATFYNCYKTGTTLLSAYVVEDISDLNLFPMYVSMSISICLGVTSGIHRFRKSSYLLSELRKMVWFIVCNETLIAQVVVNPIIIR
jgi:hypothetical protein